MNWKTSQCRSRPAGHRRSAISVAPPPPSAPPTACCTAANGDRFSEARRRAWQARDGTGFHGEEWVALLTPCTVLMQQVLLAERVVGCSYELHGSLDTARGIGLVFANSCPAAWWEMRWDADVRAAPPCPPRGSIAPLVCFDVCVYVFFALWPFRGGGLGCESAHWVLWGRGRVTLFGSDRKIRDTHTLSLLFVCLFRLPLICFYPSLFLFGTEPVAGEEILPKPGAACLPLVVVCTCLLNQA